MAKPPSDIDPLRLADTIQNRGSELGNTTTSTPPDQPELRDIDGTCEDSTSMNIVSCLAALQYEHATGSGQPYWSLHTSTRMHEHSLRTQRYALLTPAEVQGMP